MGAAAVGSERADDGVGAPRKSDPAEARPARRSVSVLGVDRSHQLQPPTRQAARGTDARADRPPHRSGRRTRRAGHPGVRRTHSAARIRPVGAGVARLQAAAAGAVLPGRNRVRRKSIQSNRRNGTTFQLLGAV